MKKQSVLLAFNILLLFISCNNNNSSQLKDTVLKVNLKEQIVPLNILFSKIEIIPLETVNSNFIKNINKIICFENNLYVFDDRIPALYIFDEDGKFIRQVAERGNGPGEYQNINDFMIDNTNDRISFLSPFGYITNYDLEGTFLSEQILPTKPNYCSFLSLSDDEMVLWSCVEEEESGISIVNKGSAELLNCFWNNDRMLDLGLLMPFYQFNNEVYFSTAYQQTVYKIQENSMLSSYQWDFGNKNIKEKQLHSYSKIKNSTERNNRILKDLETGFLPFAMEKHCQNNEYYYVALRTGIGVFRPLINVFYKKNGNISYVFKKVKEGFSIHPLLFTNEYVISILPFEEYKYLKPLLSDDEYARLMDKKEDDNPCLIKLYFNGLN